jgi:septal ring factor EnvC (AmiA/AmiB activator)
MKHTITHRLFSLFFPLAISLFFLISGCTTHKKEAPPAPVIQQTDHLERTIQQLSEELERQKITTTQLTETLEEQKQLTAQLQMSLLEKHAEIIRMRQKNDSLVREFVRNKTKLRSRGNKVETVRLIAEVAAVINTVKENRPNKTRSDVLHRAEQYLAESKVEIEQNNFEGASYLAGQALEQVQAIQLEINTDGQQKDDSLVYFLAPLDLNTMKNSNIRETPSLQAKIISILKAGSSVIAIGYKGEWVKVKIKERETGWVHYALLGAARE